MATTETQSGHSLSLSVYISLSRSLTSQSSLLVVLPVSCVPLVCSFHSATCQLHGNLGILYSWECHMPKDRHNIFGYSGPCDFHVNMELQNWCPPSPCFNVAATLYMSLMQPQEPRKEQLVRSILLLMLSVHRLWDLPGPHITTTQT